MATTQDVGPPPKTQPNVTGSLPSKEVIHIGTRKSLLARLQADEVAKALRQVCPQYSYEIHAMATMGDNNHAIALHKFNEKALWTQELEVHLQQGELDFIVHCLKDMPTQLPMGLEISTITERKDPRDALVMKASLKYHGLADLPEGSVIGTSSLRRTAQLKRHHPHLRFADIRGSVGTRLAKLDDPETEYSAIVIAVAGLARLGLSDRIASCLSSDTGGMLYAVGQGALALEVREDDEQIKNLLSHISCERTTREGLAERSLMRTLEGGCSVPIGVETEWVSKSSFNPQGSGVGVKPAGEYDNLTGVATSGPENAGGVDAPGSSETGLPDEMIMRAIVVSLDGKDAAQVETRKMISSHTDADQFGRDVARLLIEKGADKILHEIQLNRGIIKEQGEA